MENLSRIDHWCHTKVNIDQVVYAWQIGQFSFYMTDTREFLISSPFIIPGIKNIKWCLKVHPCGVDEESKDYISIYLNLLSSQDEYVKATFQFSVLGKNAERIKPIDSDLTYQFESGKDCGFKKFIPHDVLFATTNELLPDDRLTLYCEIYLVSRPITVNEEVKESTDKSRESKYTLINDLDNLLQAQILTDVTFNIGKKQLKAHRYVLAARSATFDAMFTHSDGEQLPEIIEIKDTESTVFEEMIIFIYTGQQPKSLNQFGIEFLKIAEKYKLPRLKVMCENYLSNSLTVEKAAETFVAADTCHATTLRQHALDYIDSYAMHVIGTEGYRHMLNHHSHLMKEICHALATSFQHFRG